MYRTANPSLKGGGVRVNIALFTLAIIIGLIFSLQRAFALSDNTINFQGKIVIKSNGTNVTDTSPSCVESGADTCDFRIGYYNASTGGTLLWQEDFSNIEIGDYEGIFNLVLGSGTNNSGNESSFEDVYLNNNDVYTAILLDTDGNGDFTSPESFTRDGTNRMQIRSVPFALKSKMAEQIVSSNNQFIKNQTAQQTSASFNIDGSGTIAGNLTVDTNTLFVDATNHRVGVGTTSPNYTLTIQGTLAVLEGGASPTHYTVIQGADQSATITYTLPAAMGTAGQVLATDASGNLYWTTVTGGSGTPGGNDGYIQFNDSGSFGGSANLFWDKTNFYLGIGTVNPQASIDIQPATASALRLNPYGINVGETSELRFLELAAGGSNYAGFKAPDSLTTNNIYTLPSAFPASSAFLKSDTSGNLSWDLNTYLTTVDWSQITNAAGVYMDYRPNNTQCTNGQVIKYNLASNRWECADDTSTASAAGNTGEIQFNNAGAFAASSNLFWDITNARLGIGTSTPVDKLTIIQSITTANANALGITYTQNTDATNLTGSAIDITSVSSGDAGDTNRAININNITSTSSTEFAVNIGTGWDRDFNFSNTNATWGFSDGTQLNWTDGTNNLLIAKDLSTNFGMYVEAGALVNRNSYWNEEFRRFRPTLTADTTASNIGSTANLGLGWGDVQGLGVDENGQCSFNTPTGASAINGIGRLAAAAGNGNCLAYSGTNTANTTHTMFNSANLPLILAKLRPSNTPSATTRLWVGLSTIGTAQTTNPSDGIYFTNDNAGNWVGITSSGGTATTVSCGVAISTTGYALVKAEVVSTTQVNFYIDPDVSNGISWTSCGSSTTNIPTANMGTMMMHYSSTNGNYTDFDFLRIWQDDSKETATTGENISNTDSFQKPINNNSDNTIDNTIQITGNLSIEQGSLTIDGSARINTNLFVNDEISSAGLNINCFGDGDLASCGMGIAEIYEASEIVQPAEIVAIDSNGKVSKTRTMYQNNSIGVVVKKPAMLFDEQTVKIGNMDSYEYDPFKPAIVTGGQNLLKVSTANGSISKGDYLTASSIPGTAVKMHKSGHAIGIALEDVASSGSSVIKALIKPGFADPNDTMGSLESDMKSLAETLESYKLSANEAASENSVKLDQLSKSLNINSDELGKFSLSISDLTERIAKLEEKINELENQNQTTFYGKVTIPAGELKIKIDYENELSAVPYIFLTPKSPILKGNYHISDETEKGFTIILTDIQGTDVEFNWQAVLN